MIYSKATAEQVSAYVKQNKKKIILFGAGAVCKTYIHYIMKKYDISSKVIMVIDNNPAKQGMIINFDGNAVVVRSINALEECDDDYCMIITNGEFYSVMLQLNKIHKCRDKICFISAIMQLDRVYDRSKHFVFKDFEEPQIPKIINYCWFSNNPIPDKLINCINTWKEMCPDYEIVRWDEKAFDINKYNYTKEAYELKKWGYIPDVVRLEILYEIGGFYFDTDVKIIKNLDALRFQQCFCSRERAGHINFGGGSGSVPHNEIIKEILEFRKDVPFYLGDGRFNAEASGFYETTPLMKYGLVIEDINQKLDGINVYASEFFSPYNYINGENILNDNTFSIHYFNGSWIENEEDIRKKTREKYTILRDRLRSL